MTYNVFGGTLNLALSIYLICGDLEKHLLACLLAYLLTNLHGPLDIVQIFQDSVACHFLGRQRGLTADMSKSK